MAGQFPDSAVPLLLEHIPFPAALYGSKGVLVATNDLLRTGNVSLRSFFPSVLKDNSGSCSPIQSIIDKAAESAWDVYEGQLRHEGNIITIRCNVHGSKLLPRDDLIACLSVRNVTPDEAGSPKSWPVTVPCKVGTSSGEQFECLYQLFQRAPLFIGFTDLSPTQRDCTNLWVNPIYVASLGPIKGESCSAHLLPASFIEWCNALYQARDQGDHSTKLRFTWHDSTARIIRLWFFKVHENRVGWIGHDETELEDLTDDLQGMRSIFEMAPVSMGIVRMSEDGTDYCFTVRNSRMGQMYALNAHTPASERFSAQELAPWLSAMAEAQATGRLVQFRNDYKSLGILVSLTHINKQYFACVAEDCTAWSQHTYLPQLLLIMI